MHPGEPGGIELLLQGGKRGANQLGFLPDVELGILARPLDPVFTEAAPDRPYLEIGAIEVSAAELGNSRYGDLIQRARQRAAEMGADAIIVTRDPKSHTTGFAYLPPSKKKHGQVVSATSRTEETPPIQEAAIAWKPE
jgi:hypothetical protein